MLPDFNRLKVFFHVFSNQSIVAAAAELNITQSAISQSIHKLEAEIDTPLFTRLHKRLVPTLAGTRLFAIVEPFVKELEIGIPAIKRAREEPHGLLRIGAPVEFGKQYFPLIFAQFREQHPEVIFDLKLDSPDVLLSLTGEGELDFAFVDVFLTQEKFRDDMGIYSMEPLIDEEVIMACSREYHDKHIGHDHSFDNLRSKAFISCQTHGLDLKKWFKHHFERSEKNLNIILSVDNHHAVISALKSSMGLGVVASHLVWDGIQSGRIVPITTGQNEVINRISLVQLQEKVPNLTEKSFLAFFKNRLVNTEILKHFSYTTRQKRSE
ncbi:MAG: LysR family transcriptional regulator [Desulfobacterium sp.]|nr:LysR family transcriptional regulator [Desulfobacterium sp.]